MVGGSSEPSVLCQMDTLVVEVESTSLTEEVALMKTRSGRVVSTSAVSQTSPLLSQPGEMSVTSRAL